MNELMSKYKVNILMQSPQSNSLLSWFNQDNCVTAILLANEQMNRQTFMITLYYILLPV